MRCTVFYIALLFFAFFSGRILPTVGTEPRQDNSHPPKSSAQGPLFIFSEVEPVLRRETTVPPRLPAFLPSVDKEHPIHAVLQSADRSGYDILLATELPCEGQNVCLYGSLRGSIAPLKLDGEPGIPITLRGGMRGRFIKSVCHAFCTEAYVKWREKNFYYSIGIKAEKKDVVIKAVNSAIAVAQ